MLRKKDVKWVEQNRALHQRKPRRPMRNPERQRYFRIRRRIKGTIEALISLLENMPEQQLEQTFNKDNIGHFLRALLSLESDDPERRRKRVRHLWSWLLTQFSTYTYASNLVGKDVMQLFVADIPRTIQAIYYGTLRE